MTKKVVFNTLLGGLVVLYPLLVYTGLNYLSPRLLVVPLAIILLLRLVVVKSAGKMVVPLLLALSVSMVVTLTTGSELGLLLYPVCVNAGLFVLFVYSCINPPSVIETVARLSEPLLPESAVSYTRKVTVMWAVFFLLNGIVAVVTLNVSREVWMLYNGLLVYIIIGVLFAGELFVRRRVRAGNGD